MLHLWYMKYSLSTKNVSWVHVVEPEPQEVIDFIREAHLLPADAEFIARDFHRPEISIRPDYILLSVMIPTFHKRLRVTIGAVVYFVVREGYVGSIQLEPLPVLDRFRRSLEKNPEVEEDYYEDNALSFALHIIRRLYSSTFRKLERLGRHVDIAEDAVFQGNERKMVEEISFLTRDVLDFRKILRPQKLLFSREPVHPFVTPDVSAQWEHIHRRLQRLWEWLENLFESVQELGKTNQTLIEYKENELLRFLTLYSIFAIPLLFLVDPFFNPRAGDARPLDSIVFWIVFFTLTGILLIIVGRARSKRIL